MIFLPLRSTVTPIFPGSPEIPEHLVRKNMRVPKMMPAGRSLRPAAWRTMEKEACVHSSAASRLAVGLVEDEDPARSSEPPGLIAPPRSGGMGHRVRRQGRRSTSISMPLLRRAGVRRA